MGKAVSLEDAMKRLEEISAQMSGEISIDESLKLYAQAVKLIDLASAKLDAAKLKVEKLSASKKETEDAQL